MTNLKQPLVSVCIPTYNTETTIHETLASIINQSYANLDIQIVDNASTDNTLKVVAEFDDARIKIHRNEVNVGAEGNCTRCIQVATGKYTAIFHSDDIYEPEMVQRQVEFLERHAEAGAVFTEANLIDETGRFFGNIKLPDGLGSPKHLYDFVTVFKAVLKHSNFLICPSVLARTNLYQQEIKGWRADQFGPSADLDVWLRMAQLQPIGILPLPLMRYRISHSQVSARVRLKTERADFFRVTDFYLAQNDVRTKLDFCDIQNHVRLERRDRVMRAINALLQGNASLAKELCPDVLSMDVFKAALQTRRGLGVMLLATFLKIMLTLRMNHLAIITLNYMRKLANK